MKTLLVRPPATYVAGGAGPAASLPLGLLSIAAVLERDGFEVAILDAQVDAACPVTVGKDGRIHMGLPWERVEAAIREARPEVVGISCPFTVQAENALRAAEIAKRVDGRIVTVVGGNHPTARPGDFFGKAGAVDLVCLGEGELTMAGIARSVRDGSDRGGIPGTAVRDGDGFRVNPPRAPIDDLDDLPFPAYHLVDMENYFLLRRRGFNDRPVVHYPGAERAVSLVTSRGCPFRCIFCSIHLHMGRRWRAHSPGYVLRHLEFLSSRYGIRHVHFEDDNITANARRFHGILDGIAGMKERPTWDTPNGVRVDTLSQEIVRKCRNTGCVSLVFGVESGNQEVLNKIVDKKLDLEDVTRAAGWCRDAGLDAMSFFVIGFPGETPGDMAETVGFALGLQREYGVNPGLFVATPLPGTRLEEICREKGLLSRPLSAEDLARMTQGGLAVDGGTFSAADIREMRRRFLRGYRRNVICNMISFLLANPAALPAVLRETRRGRGNGTWAMALLNAYLFRNFLKDAGRRD